MEIKTLDLEHVIIDYTNIFNEEVRNPKEKILHIVNIVHYSKFLVFISYLSFYVKEK